MGITLLGVYLQRLTVDTYVNCVIIPLCMPVERIYFVQGNPLGFNYGRYPSPERYEGWNFDDGQQIGELEELILKKLLPAWEELSDPQNCIDHFMQMAPGHRTANGAVLESQACLAAYQKSYELSLSFVSEWKEYSRKHCTAAAKEHSRYLTEEATVRTVEECILSKDYARLADQLEAWYHKSVRKLRLTKFASPLLYQSR